MKITHAPTSSHTTLTDWVARTLRQAILSGELQPGQHLSQQAISDQLRVSRIPVREALRELAAEGLIALRSYRGAVVTELTLEDLDEICALGGALEGVTAARAARMLSDGDLDYMDALLDEMEANEDRPRDWYDLNLEFHAMVIKSAGWKTASRLVKDWRLKTDRFITADQIYRANLNSWRHQHRQIYEACRARDPALARLHCEAHWSFTHQALRQHLRTLWGEAVLRQGEEAG